MHTLVVQVYALAGHAHVGTCTCISALDLVHGFVNMHAAQPSVWHFSALVRIVAAATNRGRLLFEDGYYYRTPVPSTRTNT